MLRLLSSLMCTLYCSQGQVARLVNQTPSLLLIIFFSYSVLGAELLLCLYCSHPYPPIAKRFENLRTSWQLVRKLWPDDPGTREKSDKSRDTSVTQETPDGCDRESKLWQITSPGRRSTMMLLFFQTVSTTFLHALKHQTRQPEGELFPLHHLSGQTSPLTQLTHVGP